MPLRRGLAALLTVVLAACSNGPSTAEYFNALETVTGTLEGRLGEVEAAVNRGLLEIDFGGADAQSRLVVLFQTSIERTADSFAEFVASMGALEPPPDLAAQHSEALAAGERILADFAGRADELQAIVTLEDVDAYAGALNDSTARGRYGEACRELQATADFENITVDLGCS